MDKRRQSFGILLSIMVESFVLMARFIPLHSSGKTRCTSPAIGSRLFPMGTFKACPLICYDLRFPELFRIGMQMGANLFIVIALLAQGANRPLGFLLKARAIENQAYVVGVNRAGADSETEFGGRSLFIDPMGKFLADAGTGESVTQAELDLNQLNAWREKFPVLKHARPDFLPVIR